MTAAEIEAASKVLAETAFVAALEDVASQMLGAALAGGAVSCVISVLECGLEYQRGDIAREEMHRRMGHAVTRSAGVAESVSGIIASVALAFAALIPLAAPLMMPLAALAICIVGGKVVRLGKGWHELHHEVWSRGRRGRVPMLRLRWRLIDWAGRRTSVLAKARTPCNGNAGRPHFRYQGWRIGESSAGGTFQRTADRTGKRT